MRYFLLVTLSLLVIGTTLLYLFVPFPIDRVTWAQEGKGELESKIQVLKDSFLRAHLPSNETIREIDPLYKEGSLERYYPFELRIILVDYRALLSLEEDGRCWVLLESGELVGGPESPPFIPAEFFSSPLPQQLNYSLADLLLSFPPLLYTEVSSLRVESDDRLVVKLVDGLSLYFLLEENSYKRHLPYIQLYIEKARQDAKKELHFEFSDVFAR